MDSVHGYRGGGKRLGATKGAGPSPSPKRVAKVSLSDFAPMSETAGPANR